MPEMKYSAYNRRQCALVERTFDLHTVTFNVLDRFLGPMSFLKRFRREKVRRQRSVKLCRVFVLYRSFRIFKLFVILFLDD